MNLTWIDWSIILGLLAALTVIAALTKRYTRSATDFLAANRSAGRYLLTMSEGMAGLGVASIIGSFEKFYHAGFAAGWWGQMLAPVGLIVALSGWVVYRYRETRALTMAQFFEMRYSRNFRIFAGITAWVSGTLNYGIFPAITARALIYFCGLPPTLDAAGLAIPTFPLVMAVMLTIAVSLTLFGGMIAVMITDFFQAQFLNIAFLVIMFILFAKFSWGDVVETLKTAPPKHSLLNPFDQQKVDFNVWFFAIFAFKAFYSCLAWQGTQGYNCAAKSPHEAKMARVLAEWRNGVTYLMIMLMPICAYVLLHSPLFADQTQAVQQTLSHIADPQVQKQMTVPIALTQILPIGVLGIFAAALIAAAVASDDTYLHSWGSIFIQDVVLPFRRKPLTPRQHINLLRLSIIGVAVFAFFWSLLFPQTDYIIMYFFITGTIYLGGAGAVIIGGLYWKRGTTAGAWAAMITGAAVAVVGITLQTLWPRIPALAAITPKFPLNGAYLAMVSYILSIIAYVTGSLLTCRQPFDMDRLLHRGKYAVQGEHVTAAPSARSQSRFLKALGITDEFTRGDRLIFYLKIVWTLFWFVTFLAGTAYGLLFGISDDLWANWWLFTILLGAAVGLTTVIWFLWGGIRDLIHLIRVLSAHHRDFADNGVIASPSPASTPQHDRKSPKGEYHATA